MLWRVRTSLPDRPGALALLAERCGHAEINILGLQIFPGVEAVTDELVLRAPDEWDAERIGGLVEASGGRSVRVLKVTEAALSDQPTRYVQAARAIVEKPTSFPEVVARLFDADVATDDPDADVMELTVVDAQVEVRRATPFTATEHARGAAMAALVSDALTRVPGPATPKPEGEHADATPDYVVEPDPGADVPAVRALVDGVVIGWATLDPAPGEGELLMVDLGVDPAWQRRGIGSRLLLDAARLAVGRGVGELLLRTSSDNPAVLPMVLSAGLRGRIRMAGDQLTVRVPVRDVRPLGA